MDFRQYQEQAMQTSVLQNDKERIQYGVFNTASEAGEIAGKFAKAIRDRHELDRKEVAKEMGDVLWSLACLAEGLNINLQDIAQGNIDKVNSRKERGVIAGDGDNR